MNRFRNTHLPRFTASRLDSCAGPARDHVPTSLIFPEINFLVDLGFVSIHFGIEAVYLFEHYSQLSCLGVDLTPICDALHCIYFWDDILHMSFAVGSYWNTLNDIRVRTIYLCERSLPSADPTKSPRRQCLASRLSCGRSTWHV